MHPLIAAAAEVLSLDAAELAQVPAGLKPARTSREIEQFVRTYYARQPLPPNFVFYDRYDRTPAVVWQRANAREEESAIVAAAPFRKAPSVKAVAACLQRLTTSGAELWNDEILRLQVIDCAGATARAAFSVGRFFDYRVYHWDCWARRLLAKRMSCAM